MRTSHFIRATLAGAMISGASALLIYSFAANVALAQEHKHGDSAKHKLGRKPVGDYTVSVILVGEVEPGDHVDFDIKLIDAKSDPKAMRVWIGTQDAKGSEKTEAKKAKTTFVGEVNVPKALPKDSKLWVEIETDQGSKSGWFDFDHHDH